MLNNFLLALKIFTSTYLTRKLVLQEMWPYALSSQYSVWALLLMQFNFSDIYVKYFRPFSAPVSDVYKQLYVFCYYHSHQLQCQLTIHTKCWQQIYFNNSYRVYIPIVHIMPVISKNITHALIGHFTLLRGTTLQKIACLLYLSISRTTCLYKLRCYVTRYTIDFI